MKKQTNSIILDGVSCIRGNKIVLRNISVEIPAGSCLSLKGPNGSGKSTFLKMLAGFLKNINGEISFEGNNINDYEYKNNIFFLGHNNPIKNSLTCYENLLFWSEIEGSKHLVNNSLDFLGLKAIKNLPAKFLSSGQCRRLNLSRLAFTNKKIWLLDEPTNGLDDDSIKNFIKLLNNHISNNGIVVMATHVDLGIVTEIINL